LTNNLTEIQCSKDLLEFYQVNGMKRGFLSSHHYLGIVEADETQITFGTEFQTLGHHDSGDFVFRMPISSENLKFSLSKPFSLFRFITRGQDLGVKKYKLWSSDIERANKVFNQRVKSKLQEIPLTLSLKTELGARWYQINEEGEVLSSKLPPQFRTLVVVPAVNVDFSSHYQKQIFDLLLLLNTSFQGHRPHNSATKVFPAPNAN
jgi:hypothetical protein